MNIFFLSISVKRCARYHFDSHVVKMILELTQLLSTAWHECDKDTALKYYTNGKIYKSTHINHPSTIWVRSHINNYMYTVNLALELCNEWRFRYCHPGEKKHGCEDKLLFLKSNTPNLPNFSIIKEKNNPLGFTLPMPQAMYNDCKVNPEKLSVSSCQTAYRKYYMSSYKNHIRNWTVKNPSYKNETKTPKEFKRLNLDKPWWFK